MEKTKKIIWIVALILVIVLIAVIGYGYYKKATMEVANPVVTMEVENYGIIKIELYPEIAPETVANFVTLANRGFYDGLTFHRVVKDFMIQGGDKAGTGTGSASISDLKDGGEDKEYAIKGEFIANGVENKLKFEEGVIGMARNDYTAYSPSLKEESYNSGSSQFFIMTKATETLNGYYTSFGKVIEGMDVVHAIEQVEVVSNSEGTQDSSQGEASKPAQTITIKSVKAETYGVDYGLPKTYDLFDYMSWLYRQYGLDPNTMMTSE